MIEGVATHRSIGILYRGVLLPLSEDGVGIDGVLGATNYRPLRADERGLHRSSAPFTDGAAERQQGSTAVRFNLTTAF
jgi:hypothetical protein